MGFHCEDCVYATFIQSEKSALFQGSCSRGFTLEDPSARGHDAHFAATTRQLVPTVDPFGAEYLRTSYVCEWFRRRENV